MASIGASARSPVPQPWRRAGAALVLLALAAPAGAGATGWDAIAGAISRGDFPTALRLARPLARAGDPRAEDALATMYLKGLGTRRDVGAAMQWYCRLAYHREGGKPIMRAVWFVAEFFRTGGGTAGALFADGDRARENPVRAWFWFRVMASQSRLYRSVDEASAKLGRIGASETGRELFDAERTAIAAALERWRPQRTFGPDEDCLRLPEGLPGP